MCVKLLVGNFFGSKLSDARHRAHETQRQVHKAITTQREARRLSPTNGWSNARHIRHFRAHTFSRGGNAAGCGVSISSSSSNSRTCSTRAPHTRKPTQIRSDQFLLLLQPHPAATSMASVRIEQRPGLGNVLVATEDIGQGQQVVAETPLLFVPMLKPSSTLYRPLQVSGKHRKEWQKLLFNN